MEVVRRDAGPVTILDLRGRLLGGQESVDFQETVKKLVAEGRRSVLLNMSDVNWINSTGLGVLISAYTSLKRSGGALRFYGPPERIQNIFRITRLATIFETFNDEASALASFRKT